MTKTRVARRYAEALVEMAEEQNSISTVMKDLEILGHAIKSSPELKPFLRSPIISKSKKVEILREVFAGKLRTSTLEVLEFITLKGREDVLQDIIEQFFVILDEREGVIRVDVKTAVEFSEEQISVLQKKLEQYSQKKVKIKFGVDRFLIGGFVARIGDTVLDGSIKRQLELLRVRIAQGNGTN